MRIFSSIAFRIWIIFTAVGLIISLPMAYYYNNYQFELLQDYTKGQFDVNSKITSKAVINALDFDDYAILNGILTEISDSKNYSFVAIIEKNNSGKEEVLTCMPAEMENQVLKFDSTKYLFSRAPFKTDVVEGVVIIAASKKEALKSVSSLNKPIIYLAFAAIVASMILFGFSIFFLSRPIFKSMEIANSLGMRDYNIPIEFRSGKDEISRLNNSLLNLKNNLIELDSENRSLLEGLETRVASMTADISYKNELTNVLLQVSTLFMDHKSEKSRNETYNEINEEIAKKLQFFKFRNFSLDHSQYIDFYDESECMDCFKSFLKSNSGFIENLEIRKLIQIPEQQKAIIWAHCNGHEFYNAEIFLYTFSNNSNGVEGVIFLADSLHKKIQAKEFTDMLDVYYSLLTNFNKSVIFEDELISLNKTLETKVLEKTRVNLEISNTLIAQDKLVTLGEVAAGIAHDLNTPIGSIKASAQEINQLIEEFLNIITEVESEEYQFILSFTSTHNYLNKHRTAIQKLKNSSDLANHLKGILVNQPDDQISKIASLLNNAGFDFVDFDEYEDILQLKNTEKVIKGINILWLLRSFLSGIVISSERSAGVISNLQNFVKEDLTQEKSSINLAKSIKSIEPLIRHRIKDNIALFIDIDDTVNIHGIEMKLFQVWTNISKNAIEAFEESPEDQTDKYIKIFTKIEGARVLVHFENNGPPISEENQKKIFKKFYSTKHRKNGTGLGLSIVSNIIAEHYGEMRLTSDRVTTFIIDLPLVLD